MFRSIYLNLICLRDSYFILKSDDELPASESVDEGLCFCLVSVCGINSSQELEGSWVQLSSALLQVLREVLTNGDMLILMIEVVDIVAVNPANNFKGFLASLNALLRDFSTVTEVVANLYSYLMRDDLVGEHRNFLTKVDGHRLIAMKTP